MRRAAKIDANQPMIVMALRAAGATVQTLAAVGGGVPDLLVGYHGRNLLLEVKDECKPPSKRRLTPDQAVWHATWAGTTYVVKSEQEALQALQEALKE